MTHFEKEEQHETGSGHEEKKHEGHNQEGHHKETHHHAPKKNKTKLNSWKLATVVLAAILVVVLFLQFTGETVLSKEEAGIQTLQFVNQNLLQGQATAKLESVTEEGELYNVKLTISGQEVNSYVTKDGELFFPQGMKTTESVLTGEATAPSARPEPAANLVKSDKPVVELFVMSHCPYGTQAEKGILPVVNLLGNKIDFELKFVYYAMHGQTELDEQLNQFCIQEEQNAKFNEYLACFLEDGDSDRCLTKVGINTAKMDSCVARTDSQYKVTELFNDRSTWLSGNYPLFNVHKTENEAYGVGGSPTLVINGAQANSARNPAAYLATICAAFNEAPEECTDSEGVSTETYSPGFGYEIGAATAASCG
jgi:hypothetical protein